MAVDDFCCTWAERNTCRHNISYSVKDTRAYIKENPSPSERL